MKVTAEVLQEALLFAVIKHQDQYRKCDGRPYILHPISVLMTLDRLKKSKNKFLLSTAAVLHDVVEDCQVDLSEVATKFGYQVAAIVEELTSDNVAIQSMGKKEYLLQKMQDMSSYALCIKLCDRLDNVSDLKDTNVEFQTKVVDETLYILDNLQRELTSTHKKIIKKIRQKIDKLEIPAII